MSDNMETANSSEMENSNSGENTCITMTLKYKIKEIFQLLKNLNEENLDVPLSIATLIDTRQKVVKRAVDPGVYFHIGIEYNLLKFFDVIIFKNITEIFLNIDIDGLPLFKNSDTGLWPILGRVVNVLEINVFKDLGFSHLNNKIYVKIRSFICDAPATTFICGVIGHNSLNGCCKCELKGESNSRVTTFSTSVFTKKNFEIRKYWLKSQHKNGDTISFGCA